MTRILLAIALLPLAFVVGCGELIDPDSTEEVECTHPQGCLEGTNVGLPVSATIVNTAPYGWVGNHYETLVEEQNSDLECEAASTCEMGVEELGEYEINLSSETFDCVKQFATVSEDGEVVEVPTDAWLGEGICGLVPNGEYSGWDVWTRISDWNGDDQVWILIDYLGAVITGDTFFYEDDSYLLEGAISDDLSSIDYRLYNYATDRERTGTLYLED